MKCPLCDTTLPDGAQECTRCDWVKVEKKPNDTRDITALILSVVPGLGHLYKGHVLFGGLIFFVVGPALLTLCMFLAPATLGLSMLIPPAFLLGVMVHALLAADRRKDVISTARAWDTGHQHVPVSH